MRLLMRVRQILCRHEWRPSRSKAGTEVCPRCGKRRGS